jgi:hypothetical protein
MKKLFIFSIILGLLSPVNAATTTNKASYGSSNQALTISAAQSNNQQSVSTAVDNTSNLFLDALVMCNMTSAGSGTSTTGTVNVYAAGTSDGGTTYSDGVGASSATVTLTSPPNVRLIGICNVVANSTSYKCGPYSVAAAFGGVLPDHWSIVLENKTGGTTSSQACNYQGLYVQNL